MPRNYTKVRILEVLYNNGCDTWWTSGEIAQSCWLSTTNSSELLRRYARQGLVERQRNQAVPKGYWYHLTKAGYQRLVYLQETFVSYGAG
jgi:DNA-binding MarR family transcriptional regulator